MTREQILGQIQKYKGTNPYILSLLDKQKAQLPIGDIQLTIVKKLLADEKKKQKKQLKSSLVSVAKRIEVTKLKHPRKIKFTEFSSYRTPRDYQIQGINWLLASPTRWLWDEQGLGKTFQTLYACVPQDWKTLIVCPSYLKYNWYEELIPFLKILSLEDEVQVINSTTKKFENKRFTIINYELLKKNVEHLLLGEFDLIIIDESQYIKNEKSERTVFTLNISKVIPRVWLLTGTPKSNKTIDLFSQLQVLRHPLGQNKYYFGNKYCGGEENTNSYGADFSGSSNILELHKVLTSSVALRRTKKQVAKDLPDQIESVVYLHLNNYKEYVKKIKDYYAKAELDSIGGSDQSILTHILYLNQFYSINRIEQTKQLIDNALEHHEKVVVFSNFTNTINALAAYFPGISLVYDGRVKTAEQKQRIINEFQTNPSYRLIIGQYDAMHAGTTLTAANGMVQADAADSPGIDSQAQARIHRLGQEKDCTYYRPVYKNSWEEIQYHLQKQEQKVSDALTEGTAYDEKQGDYYKLLRVKFLEFLNNLA